MFPSVTIWVLRNGLSSPPPISIQRCNTKKKTLSCSDQWIGEVPFFLTTTYAAVAFQPGAGAGPRCCPCHQSVVALLGVSVSPQRQLFHRGGLPPLKGSPWHCWRWVLFCFLFFFNRSFGLVFLYSVWLAVGFYSSLPCMPPVSLASVMWSCSPRPGSSRHPLTPRLPRCCFDLCEESLAVGLSSLRHFLFKPGGTSPLFCTTSPGYPLTSSTVYSPPPRPLPRSTFSRPAFNLKKPYKYCNWKCAALSAIVISVTLVILLAYFIGKPISGFIFLFYFFFSAFLSFLYKFTHDANAWEPEGQTHDTR